MLEIVLMTSGEKSSAVLFSSCVDRYESWIVSNKESPFRSALDCASILSELNFRALSLPSPNAKILKDIDEPVFDPEEIESARQAGLQLPVRHYLKIFNPSDP